MSEFDNYTVMKPEDLTLELFSLQLELDQVPYGVDSPPADVKMTTAEMMITPISTAATASHHHHMFDLNTFGHHPQRQDDQHMFMEHHISPHCPVTTAGSLFSFTAPAAMPPLTAVKSSDEDTVIHDEIMDVIQQSMSETSSCTEGEKTAVEVYQPLTVMVSQQQRVSQATNTGAAVTPTTVATPTTPTHSNIPSPSGGYYSGNSSRGGPPSPASEIAGRKKKLKTRHARDSTHTHSANQRPAPYSSPYESPPTPATPTSTPVSSCPSSPSGLSGYHSRESNKSNSSRGKEGDKSKVPRHKRPSHIKAEHKRRNKIQSGMEDLQKLVPTLADVYQAGGKDSKSAVLSRTVDYCRQLRSETKDNRSEMNRLRAEIESLRAEINAQQGELPPTGARLTPGNVTPKEEGKVVPASTQNIVPHTTSSGISCSQMFNDYVNSRSLSNWKFWIFGMLIRPLFESYNTNVTTSNHINFSQSVINWCKNQCSLISLRPAVFTFLRKLSDRTSIRTNPALVPDEVIQSVIAENFPSPKNSSPALDRKVVL